MEAPALHLCLRRVLAAAHSKSVDVAAQMHPGWLARGWQRLGLQDMATSVASATGARRFSAALATLYGLQWPALDRFDRPAHRIALLPLEEMRRVLAAVALHGERGRMRLSIGRGTRALLIDRVGEAAYARMLEAPPLRVAQPRALSAAELDPDRLAAVGLRALVAANEIRSEGLLPWLRLGIAPDDAGQTSPDPASASDALDRLVTYFPEHAWLFGFSMNPSPSASTTA